MKTIKLFVIVLLLGLTTRLSATTWSTLNTGTQNHYWGIKFLNETTGFAVGSNGKIIKTSNGGNTWVNIPSGTSAILFSIDFNNKGTGIIVGDSKIVLRSTNYGDSWYVINLGAGEKIRRVKFVNDNLVFGVGDPGVVYKSSNGGINWTSTATVFTGGIKGLSFMNENDGIVVGLSGSVFKTSNSGMNWNLVNIPVLHTLEQIDFNNESIAVAVGYDGAIYKINNGDWQNIPSITSSWLFGVEFANNKVAIAVGSQGKIIKTTNAGSTWVNTYSGGESFYDISIVDGNVGYVCGMFGMILKSETITAISNIGNSIPEKFNLEQNYPNPFNPVTNIRFNVRQNENVKIEVFDVRGNLVNTLVDTKLNAGEYQVTFDGSNLSSGTYIYRMISGDYIETKKMNLIK